MIQRTKSILLKVFIYFNNLIITYIMENFPITIPDEVKRVEFVSNDEAWDSIKTKIKLDFKDSIINTFPKTGTTALIYMCHLIKGGDSNWTYEDEIALFIELCWNMNIYKPKYGNPYLYKSHLAPEILLFIFGEKTKLITSIRDPISTIKSYYYFLVAKSGDPQTVNIDGVINMNDCGQFFMKQFYSYFLCRKLKTQCFVIYEDLLDDVRRKNVIERISKFLEIKDVDIEKILKMTSKEEMLKINDKFDDSFQIQICEKNNRPNICNLNKVSKVTDGKHQNNLSFSENNLKLIQEMWDETFGKEGFKNYEELVDFLRKEQSNN